MVQPFVVTVDATKTRVSNMKRARSLACLGNVYLGSRESPQCQKLVCGMNAASTLHVEISLRKMAVNLNRPLHLPEWPCNAHFNLGIELNRGRVASNEQRMFSPQFIARSYRSCAGCTFVTACRPENFQEVAKRKRLLFMDVNILLITSYPWFFSMNLLGQT